MKKQRLLRSLAAAVVLGGSVAVLAACGGDEEEPNYNEVVNVPVTGFSLELTSSKNLVVNESIHVVPMDITPTDYTDGQFTYESDDSLVASVDSNGKITALSEGIATITVTSNNFDGDEEDATKTVTVTVSGNAEESAGGAYNYSADSYEDQLEILGKLEEYAYDNNLTGIPFFEDGSYVMYSNRIEKGTENYISGYGFGILTEGRLTSANSYYQDEGTGMYYHTYGGEQHEWQFNYLDDTGSQSHDLYDYVAGQYYNIKMNDTSDGYEWYPQLAEEFPTTDPYYSSSLTETQLNRPVALNANDLGLATEFRIYLKTGYEWNGSNYTESAGTVDEANGLFYHTADGAKYENEFDGRPVSIMDYVYPYMFLINGSLGLSRHADYISSSSDGTLSGATTYSTLTSTSASIYDEDLFFDNVGINIGVDNDPQSLDAPCITFTLQTPVSEFDAMYALSEILVSPIPIDFITTLGMGTYTEASTLSNTELDTAVEDGLQESYGISNTTYGTNPVDNMLSVDAFILDYVDDNEIQFVRNDDYINKFEPDRYDSSIEGVAIHYISSGRTTAFQWFIEEGSLDVATIPQDYLSQYKDDARTTTTQGDATFKLNTNTTTQETWESIFGIDGVNSNGTTEEDYYQVNPFMSNQNFVDALSYAIDRETYANNRGYIPSQDYFADVYVWQPEEGRSYNETAQHLGNIADRSPDTYGYNFDVAVTLMDQAIDEVIADPSNEIDGYKDYTTSEYGGTDRDSNNLGVIEVTWMRPTNLEEYGDEILEYWEEVLEATDAYRRGFRIEFTQVADSSSYLVVYDKMEDGEFDLAFGSISGMELDPLGFMEVLKSDNSSGFTLSYSKDTDTLDEENGQVIYYNGRKWTFDGLWNAANTGVIIGTDGKVSTNPLGFEFNSFSSTSINIDSVSTNVYALAIEYEKATAAAAVDMRLSTSSTQSSDTFLVIGSYTYTDNDEEVTASVALSYDLATYASLNDNTSGSDITGTLTSGTLTLNVPQQLTTDVTGLDQTISLADLDAGAYVYLSVYTTYTLESESEYTVSNSYSVSFSVSS